MKRPPRPLNESFFAHRLWLHILWVGLLMGGCCLWVQHWGITHDAHWQTMVFTTLCLSQFGHALAIRSERLSLFSMGLWSNPYLTCTVLISIGAQVAIIYHPFLQRVFHTQPLTFSELAVAGAVSSVVFIGVEIEKLLKRARG